MPFIVKYIGIFQLFYFLDNVAMFPDGEKIFEKSKNEHDLNMDITLNYPVWNYLFNVSKRYDEVMLKLVKKTTIKDIFH